MSFEDFPYAVRRGRMDAPVIVQRNLEYLGGKVSEKVTEVEADIAALQSSAYVHPPGSVEFYAGASAPTGWLMCDGAAVSRPTYAALFTAISTPYGAGDGSTTFNVPDLRGRVAVGKGTHPDVDALNDNDGATLSNRRPKHKHDSQQNVYNNANGSAITPDLSGMDSDFKGAITVGPSAPGTPTDTPSYVVLNAIIKT